MVKGPRDKPVLLQVEARPLYQPLDGRGPGGEGKDKLAKLMRKSPIRYVGPIYQGGIAELSHIPE